MAPKHAAGKRKAPAKKKRKVAPRGRKSAAKLKARKAHHDHPSRYKPVPIPADYKKTAKQINKWAAALIDYCWEVYDELHLLKTEMAQIRVAVPPTHIGDPPHPPFE
jgi:hypothetical protein